MIIVLVVVVVCIVISRLAPIGQKKNFEKNEIIVVYRLRTTVFSPKSMDWYVACSGSSRSDAMADLG
jgi:hypothetical protein